jgi:hypothetical protein
MQRGKTKTKGGLRPSPDPDEIEGLRVATDAAKSHGLRVNAEAVVTEIISAWITTRAKLVTEGRLVEKVVFDLGDAKLRGQIAACLPDIATSLQLASFPFEKPLGQLSKDEITTLFQVGHACLRENQIAADGSPGILFDDEVPF